MPVRGNYDPKRTNEHPRNTEQHHNSNLRVGNNPSRQQHGHLEFYSDALEHLDALDQLEALLEHPLPQDNFYPSQQQPSNNIINSLEPRLSSIIQESLIPPPRQRTPRSVPRTRGTLSNSALSQIEAIRQNMTFSDAEEDQSNRTPATNTQSSGADSTWSRARSGSRSRTESGISNASTASLVTPNSSTPSASVAPSAMVSSTTSATAAATGSASDSGAVAAAGQTENSLDLQGVDSAKIIEKLNQIQGYIQQTSSAMQALQSQGDAGKGDQYNTLDKVMRDLRDSETKLRTHLDAALAAEKAKSSEENQTAAEMVNGRQQEGQQHSTLHDMILGTAVDANSLQHFENLHSQAQSMVVDPDSEMSEGERTELQQRIDRTQVETASIMGRMRESIQKREDLMNRYKATRVRLDALKKRRSEEAAEQQVTVAQTAEVNGTQSNGTSEATEEEPIPEANTWTMEQLDSGIADFSGLHDKVENLMRVYREKAHTVGNDVVALREIAQKIERLKAKKQQLSSALVQLTNIKTHKLAQLGGASNVSDQATPLPMQPMAAGESEVSAAASSEVPEEMDDETKALIEKKSRLEALVATANANNVSANAELANLSTNMETLRAQMANNDLNAQEQHILSLRRQLAMNESAASELESVQDNLTARKSHLEGLQKQLQDFRNRIDAGDTEGMTGENVAQALEFNIEPMTRPRKPEENVANDAAAQAEFMANPAVIAKTQELNDTKARLAKMEEVTALINSARESGQDVRSALTAEHLAVLEGVESEMGGNAPPRRQQRALTPTEEERRIPSIQNKYEQLTEARQRLAKMEEVLELVASAQAQGRDYNEVLSPEHLALLEGEDAEFSNHPAFRGSRITDQDAEDQIRSANRGGGATGGPAVNADARQREADNLEISAMQKSLNKTTPQVSNVNDGSLQGEDKETNNKNTQLWRQGNMATTASADPRLYEVMAMQEELRQKKNALEALMRRMGKASSLDNISDNISEVTDRMDGPTSATWGATSLRHYADNYYRESSDDQLVEDNNETNAHQSFHGSQSRHQQYQQQHQQHQLQQQQSHQQQQQQQQQWPQQQQSQQQQQNPPKERNRWNGSRQRRRQDSEGLSVNNLGFSQSTRPKQNRHRGSSVPKASWENVQDNYGVQHGYHKSPSNNMLQAQQTLNAALSQLSAVQNTINTLQGKLDLGQDNRVLTPGGNHYTQQQQQHPQHQQQRQQQQQQQQQQHQASNIPLIPPMSNIGNNLVPPPLPGMPQMTGLPPQMPNMHTNGGTNLNASNSQGGNDATQMGQVLSGLQQCFSQLYLHSLEIQALSKHLQLLDQRESPKGTNGGRNINMTGNLERQRTSDRNRYCPRTRRSEEDEDEDEDEEDDEDTLHRNLLAAHRSKRDGVSSGVLFRKAASGGSNGGRSHLEMPQEAPSGVTNPMYDQLGGDSAAFRHHQEAQQIGHQYSQTSTWGVHHSNNHPEEGGTSRLSEPDGMSHERREANATDHNGSHQHQDAWESLPASLPLHHQTPDLLNNQVPPGSRANNYWDNFRSYSRQNLLSTTAKSNTTEQRLQGPRSTVLQRGSSRYQIGSGCGNNGRLVNPTRSNNSNSLSGRGSGGARLRVNTRMQPHDQNKRKTNNRLKQGRDRINYNSARGTGSESEGHGGLTREVLREAESLIARHSQQPDFLLQLFRHAAQITVTTDQHVALALLQDLAMQPHNTNNQHGNLNTNSGASNNSNSNSLSLPAPLREPQWRSRDSRLDLLNNMPVEMGSGVSASEISDSGLTSEDEDSRTLYRNVKNLSLSPGVGGVFSSQVRGGAVPRLSNSQKSSHNQPCPSSLHRNQMSHYNDNHSSAAHNLQPLNNQQGSTSINSENPVYDHIIYNDAQMMTMHSRQREIEEPWLAEEDADICDEPEQQQQHKKQQHQQKQQSRKTYNRAQPTPSSQLRSSQQASVSSSSEADGSLTFETLVSGAVCTTVNYLQNVKGAESVGSKHLAQDRVGSALLASLHLTLLNQIEGPAENLQLPPSFLQIVDKELKAKLQPFQGKKLSEVANEVPSVVSQVLLSQYCAVLVHRICHRPPLPTADYDHNTMVESGVEGSLENETNSLIRSKHQEDLSKTNTHNNNLSLTSSPRRTAHNTVPNSTENPARGVVNGMWQLPVGLLQSSSLSGHGPQEQQSGGDYSLPNSRPESWNGHGNVDGGIMVGQGGSESSTPVSRGPESQAMGGILSGLVGRVSDLGASASWNEHHQHDLELDVAEQDLSQPILPVHDLAEADQSQDAVDEAEGSWEDSQVEGLQGELPPQPPHSTPTEVPTRLIPGAHSLSVEADGPECSGDEAAEGSIQPMRPVKPQNHTQDGSGRESGLDEVPTKLQNPGGIQSSLVASGGRCRGSGSVDQRSNGPAVCAAADASVSAPPSPPPSPPPLEPTVHCTSGAAGASSPQRNNLQNAKIPNHSPAGSEG